MPAMKFEVDKARLDSIVKEAAQVLEGKNIPNLYAILAFAEIAGRVIVTCANNKLELDNMRKIATDHLNRTALVGGWQMKGIQEDKARSSLILPPGV